MHSAVNRAGRRIHVVHNWSWQPATVTAPAALVDILDDSTGEDDGTAEVIQLELAAWDVRVLREL